MQAYDESVTRSAAAMTKLFHDHLEVGNFEDAAQILSRWTQTQASAQAWLMSATDNNIAYLLSADIVEIAATWDEAQA